MGQPYVVYGKEFPENAACGAEYASEAEYERECVWQNTGICMTEQDN